MIERGGRINYIYKRDEHILAKVKAKRHTKTDSKTSEFQDETKDRVKDFEDFEKVFLAKKGFLPQVSGPRGKKLQHTMSQSQMAYYKVPSTPRSGVMTPTWVPVSGRRSRKVTTSNDSNVSSRNSQRKSYTPLTTSLTEGNVDIYQAMEQNKHYRTKNWVQKGFIDSQDSLQEDEELLERSRSRVSQPEV